MNQEVKEKWVAALRSGKYQQAGGHLRDGDQFCCLGVLCDISGMGTWAAAVDDDERSTFITTTGDRASGTLPFEVQDWAGLTSSTGDPVYIAGDKFELAGHNDGGATFEQIADAIEAQL